MNASKYITQQHDTTAGTMQLMEEYIQSLPVDDSVSGMNNYLLSLIDAKVFSGQYPDNQAQRSTMKSIPTAQSYLVEPLPGFRDEYRFLFPSKAAADGFAVERRSDTGQWYHIDFITPAQQLQDPGRYSRVRMVSSVLEVKSMTIASGTFELNGLLNAVRLFGLPPVSWEATYDELLPYAVSARIRSNVPVLDGIVVTQPYTDNCNFRVPYQLVHVSPEYIRPSAYSSLNAIAIQWNYGVTETKNLFTLQENSNTGFRVSSDPRDPQYSPNFQNMTNVYQNHKLRVAMSGMNDPVNANLLYTIKVRVGMNRLDGTTTTEYFELKCGTVNNIPQGALSSSFAKIEFETTFFAYQQIQYIEILNSTPAFPLGITGGTLQDKYIDYFTVSLEQENMDLDGSSSITVVNFNAGTPDQQIAISGTTNYEFIAGNKLMLDLHPVFSLDANTEDLEKARLVMAALESRGMACVYTGSEYAEFLSELDPLNFERSRLRYLSAAWVLPAFKMLRKGFRKALKYGGPVLNTISQVRAGTYQGAKGMKAFKQAGKRYYSATQPGHIPSLEQGLVSDDGDHNTMQPEEKPFLQDTTTRPNDIFITENLKVAEIPEFEYLIPTCMLSPNSGVSLVGLAENAKIDDQNFGSHHNLSIKPGSGGRRIMGPFLNCGIKSPPETQQTRYYSSTNRSGGGGRRMMGPYVTFGPKKMVQTHQPEIPDIDSIEDTHKSLRAVAREIGQGVANLKFKVSRDHIAIRSQANEGDTPELVSVSVTNMEYNTSAPLADLVYKRHGTVVCNLQLHGLSLADSRDGTRDFVDEHGSAINMDDRQSWQDMQDYDELARLTEFINIFPKELLTGGDLSIIINCPENTEGVSWAFAMEAVLNGLANTIIYCGDSSPSNQFNPIMPMQPSHMQTKAKYDEDNRPIAFKLPFGEMLDNGLMEAALQVAEDVGGYINPLRMPSRFLIDSSVPLYVMETNYGSSNAAHHDNSPQRGPVPLDRLKEQLHNAQKEIERLKKQSGGGQQRPASASPEGTSAASAAMAEQSAKQEADKGFKIFKFFTSLDPEITRELGSYLKLSSLPSKSILRGRDLSSAMGLLDTLGRNALGITSQKTYGDTLKLIENAREGELDEKDTAKLKGIVTSLLNHHIPVGSRHSYITTIRGSGDNKHVAKVLADETGELGNPSLVDQYSVADLKKAFTQFRQKESELARKAKSGRKAESTAEEAPHVKQPKFVDFNSLFGTQRAQQPAKRMEETKRPPKEKLRQQKAVARQSDVGGFQRSKHHPEPNNQSGEISSEEDDRYTGPETRQNFAEDDIFEQLD